MKNFETLEVGKTYKNRCGMMFKIVGHTDHVLYPYGSDKGSVFTEDGRFYVNESSPYDLVLLIEEVDSSVSANYVAPPPIGVIPYHAWQEKMHQAHQIELINRLNDLMAAVDRYVKAGKKFPEEWVEEMLRINSQL